MSAARAADPVGVAARTAVVVGLGNPVLGDDGAGWAVADAVELALVDDARHDLGNVRIARLAVGGLTLMERLVGFRRAIIVDAILTGDVPPGTVRRLRLDDLPGHDAGHVDSAHDTSLAAALVAGRALGAELPDTIDLVTIEAASVLDLRETLTPDVAAAVPRATAEVIAMLTA